MKVNILLVVKVTSHHQSPVITSVHISFHVRLMGQAIPQNINFISTEGPVGGAGLPLYVKNLQSRQTAECRPYETWQAISCLLHH